MDSWDPCGYWRDLVGLFHVSVVELSGIGLPGLIFEDFELVLTWVPLIECHPLVWFCRICSEFLWTFLEWGLIGRSGGNCSCDGLKVVSNELSWFGTLNFLYFALVGASGGQGTISSSTLTELQDEQLIICIWKGRHNQLVKNQPVNFVIKVLTLAKIKYLQDLKKTLNVNLNSNLNQKHTFHIHIQIIHAIKRGNISTWELIT